MKKFIGVLFIMLLLFSAGASADRGSIPFRPGVNIFEPGQDALIAWNGEEEILILSTELSASEPTKVLQVLPLPAEPEVTKSSRDVLRRANEFAFQGIFNQLRQPVLRSSDPSAPAAEIKEEVVIGSHDIIVVEVLNQDYFVSWVNDYLKNRGESSPQIPEPLKNTVNNYINRGYNYFVFDTIEVGPEPELNQAISYHFKSKELYYPLEITKSDHGISEISLLILTDQNLVNYNGLEQSRIKEKTPTVKLSYGETAYISTSIADLFIKNINDLEADNKKVKLLNWSIKDDLANFNTDLLVDQQLEELLKNKFVYQGTTFVDYKAEANYPYSSQKEIETIKGKIEKRMGSRMYPWIAASVKGKVLFNASTRALLNNFAAEGENVIIKGYSSDQGQIGMRDPIDKMPVLVGIRDVFYVTEIVGWTPYTGIALSGEGELNNTRTRFWLKNR
ncbi:uncharacterized protein DUF2330 [Halanaerobium saccharolyticum]|uniref:Uncharacterized protein DUF2330 n=1 Tax=Halanaerobium saccharolyticum TaxID=43595 RepID=A0A4R6LSH5_9FIRM|nr:DUF2330 domain-containing protein [Halanaerobium saccharolyticum]TDO91287.1 uncharacterized protein DUF2330 [Halanaerobium saccharolyticum]